MKDKARFISRYLETSFTENARGFLIKEEKGGKLLKRRQILLLIQEPTSGLEKIGTARGQDLYHCIYLASKYGKDFVEIVVAYFVNDRPKDKKFKMEVTFYKKTEDQKGRQ